MVVSNPFTTLRASEASHRSWEMYNVEVIFLYHQKLLQNSNSGVLH